MDFTTTQLISDIRRRAGMPDNQDLYSSQDIVDALSDVLYRRIVPLIQRANEEFFVAEQQTSIVADQREYDIPTRATGGRLREIRLFQSGTDLPGIKLSRFAPESVEDQPVRGYYLQGSQIILDPKPTSTDAVDKVLLRYFRRPGRLALTTNAGKINSIDTGTGVLSLDNVPSSWTTSTKVDIISGIPHFKSYSDSFALLGVSGNDVTVSTALAGQVAVGDYVSNEYESPIPQIPYEGFPLLTTLTLIDILPSIGKQTQADKLERTLRSLESDLLDVITPRVEGDVKSIANLNELWRW